MSIRKKLILMMVLISFIPLVLLSAISIRYLSKSLEEETISQCRESANGVKLQIDGLLDRPFNAIKAISANPTVKKGDLLQIKTFLVQTQKAYPDVSFTFDDVRGNQAVRGDDIALVNIWDRVFFQAALKGNEEVISEVIFSRNSNRFVINLATPVRNTETGSVVGVMQSSITLVKISEFVTNLSINGIVAYVIDGNGKILAHPDASLVKERVDMSEASFVKIGLGERKNGFLVIEDNSTGKKLVTYQYDKRTGWLICLEVPYAIITDKTHTLFVMLSLITLVVLGIVGLIVFFTVKHFTEPILQIQKMASQISQGDLTQQINISSKDEIGLLAQAFDTMVIDLKKLIGQVQVNAEMMMASSEELTASAEQSALTANQVAISIKEVAQGADQQLYAVHKASEVVEQMSANIQQVAANANTVSEQSAKVAETAKEGGKSVESAVRQMRGLEQTVSTSAQVVTHLGERSKEIGQIVDTISGIAGQTNLLALNAAIEAARAGEQGRGFAVVAEEVRKLAEQSQEAAKQIGNMIGEIQGETDRAVSAMNEGTREVKIGVEIVTIAGEAFQGILGQVTQLSDRVGEISTAIQHMNSGSRDIVLSVRDIDKLTQATTGEAQTVSAATEEQSASMEEIASSSQSLAKMAQNLQEAVSKFRI